MSTSAYAGSWLAWEDSGAGCIGYGNLDPKIPIRAIGRDNPKHPAIAVNARGEFLLAWTEKTGWDKGGSLSWQVFDAKGEPIAGASGRAEDLPPWDTPAAVAGRDGGFAVFY